MSPALHLAKPKLESNLLTCSYPKSLKKKKKCQVRPERTNSRQGEVRRCDGCELWIQNFQSNPGPTVEPRILLEDKAYFEPTSGFLASIQTLAVP